MFHNKIRNIIQETAERIEKLHVPYENEFKVQIHHLSLKEKSLLQEYLYAHEWNLGSARVLSMFKKARIISISEYVLRLHTKDTIQQVMNDLLEAEPILLAELISNSASELFTSLKDILHESFSTVLDDLLENPVVIPFNYLAQLEPHLTDKEIERVRLQHLELLLRKDCACTLQEAIGRQDQWRAEAKANSGTILGQMMRTIVHDTVCSFDVLLGGAEKLDANFSWKHYLCLLGIVAKATTSEYVNVLRVKGAVKNMFNKILTEGKFANLLLLMLTSREICATDESILGNYNSWYKYIIGEMTYRVDKAQFLTVMGLMNKLVPLEESVEILKVHSSVSISFPSLCMEHVVTFKNLCKSRIMKIEETKCRQEGVQPLDPDISIVIDSDDD
uniref:Fanconi anaemia group A protein N-terminal domain-containing protein n=1 Tax=Culex tarsalis TaxID=7177 RepID=A0A1Q3F0E2_CULTA